MDVQKLTHEVRLQQWSKTVTDCRSSGKSVKSWCDGRNINIKTYYYWQNKVCQATCREIAMNHPQPSIEVNANPIAVFAELRKPDHPSGQLALTIQRNHMEIQIYRGADAADGSCQYVNIYSTVSFPLTLAPPFIPSHAY